jgi:zinc protease
MDDLSAASEEDVKDFFRLYYAPNNAVLVICGDFDAAAAKAWVAKYFSGVPQGKAITRPKAGPVTLAAETRLVFEDRVQTPRLYIQWPTVGEQSDDRFALRVLDTVLTGPRTARLTKALVYDQQIAANVEASQDTHENAGEFLLTVTPRPGHTLTEIEAVVDSIIDKLKRDGPSNDEIQKATAGLELSFLTNLQSNLGKTFRLASGAGYHNDAGYYRVEYQKSTAVTASDVKRAANKYLTAGRVVLSVVPPGLTGQASRASESKRVDMYDTPQNERKQ